MAEKVIISKPTPATPAKMQIELPPELANLTPEQIVERVLSQKKMQEYGKNYDAARTEAIHALIKAFPADWTRLYNEKRKARGLDPVRGK